MSELYHFNIKGSHWGVRRFQNEDGTWTPLGLLRRRDGRDSSSAKAEPQAAKPPKVSKETTEKPRQKSLSEMSDKELEDSIKRLRNEATYKELMAARNPKKEHRVLNFIKSSFGGIAKDAITSVARKATDDFMMKTFGVSINKGEGAKKKEESKRGYEYYTKLDSSKATTQEMADALAFFGKKEAFDKKMADIKLQEKDTKSYYEWLKSRDPHNRQR